MPGRRHFFLLAVGLWLATVPASAQPPGRERLEALARTDLVKSFDLLHDLLSIPNDAQVGPTHLKPNVAWMSEAFEARGFTIREPGGRIRWADGACLLADRRTAG